MLSYKPGTEASKGVRAMPTILITPHIHALLTDMSAEAGWDRGYGIGCDRYAIRIRRVERITAARCELHGHSDASLT